MPPASSASDRSVRDGYLETSGARLYWRQVGSGTPLIVLHGGPDFDHNYLLPELDALGAAFRLIYYDQRGRGRSSGSVEPSDVSLASELEDLEALRMFLDVGAVALLGHSFGAILAMEYAARWPQHVSHLVLMNPPPASHADRLRFLAHRQTRDADTLARMKQMAATPQYASGDVATEAEYYRLHFGSALKDPRKISEVVARLRVHFTSTGILKARAIEERLHEQTWNKPDYNVISRLGGQAPPTLVIHGGEDFFPLSGSESIVQGLPGARLEVLSDCGHFAYLERPRETCELIRGFVVPA